MANIDPAMLVPSATVLRGDLSRVHEALAEGLTVFVVGSSHSAFSALGLVLESAGMSLRPGQLVLVHRELRLYFASVTEARACGYAPGASEIDEDSGEVNRFCGLRGEARELCLALQNGEEDRVTMLPWSCFARRSRRALYVVATGYKPRAMVVSDVTSAPAMASRAAPHGLEEARPHWHADRVDTQCRVLNPSGGSPLKDFLASALATQDCLRMVRTGSA